jgi:hypothetical protein
MTELHEVRTRLKGFWDFSQGKTSGDFSKDRNRFVASFSGSGGIRGKKVSLRRELCVSLKNRHRTKSRKTMFLTLETFAIFVTFNKTTLNEIF